MNEFGFVADAPDVGFVPDSTESDDIGFVAEAAPLDESNLPADMSPRQRRRLELASELAAERSAQESRDRANAPLEFIGNLGEGAQTALSLSPSAVIAQFERGIPATAAVLRGDETFTPLPPVVSSSLNPGENRAIKIPDIATTKDTPIVGQIAAGLGNAVIDFANIFTTPEGIATLGIGGLPKNVQKQVVGTMAANMAAHYPEEFSQAVDAAKAGDFATATRKVVSTPVMASVMGRASLDMPKVPKAPEFPGLPDPDLVARNVASPGTVRPQEIQRFAPPEIDAPQRFEAGNVPFERMQRMGGVQLPPVQILPQMGRIENVPILEETRPKVELETRGKVSFGAEAPTLLRESIAKAEEVGLTKSAEAAAQVARGENRMPPYRAPKPATPESVRPNAAARRAAVEQGLTMENPPMEPLPPEVGQFPPPVGMPEGTLSRLQSSRIQAGKQNVRSNVRNNPPEPTPRKTLKQIRDELEKGERGGERGAIDPSILEDIAAHGRTILKKGMEFADWSAEMVRQFGQSVSEHLKPIWDRINPTSYGKNWKQWEDVAGEWLGAANELSEKGRTAQAEKMYRKAELALMRSNELKEKSTPKAPEPTKAVEPVEAVPESPKEAVTAAAIRLPNGDVRTGSIHALIDGSMDSGAERGFVTDKGRFVSEKEAGSMDRKKTPMPVRGDVDASEIQDPFRRETYIENEIRSAKESELESLNKQLTETRQEITDLGFVKIGDRYSKKSSTTTTTLPEATKLSKRPSAELEAELAAAREAVRSMPKPDPKEIAGMTQDQLAVFLDARSKAKIDAAVKVQALEEALKLSKEAEKAKATEPAETPPRPPKTESGIISGSKLEKWADDVLTTDPRKKTRGTLLPIDETQRVTALAIKGAAIIERGVRDFAKWSEEMVNKYGPDIKDSLKQIYDQSVALIEREKTTKAVPSSGTAVGPEKMRKSAERATTAEMVPPPVQETIKTAPESRYNQQSMNRVEEVVGAMDDAQLGTVSKDTDIYTAAKLEQARRLFEKGDNDAGYQVFVELEKEGTRLGQLINQFKLLDGTRPEQVVSVIDTGLKKAGKDGLTPAQTAEAMRIAKDAKAKDGALTTATEAWKTEPTKENAAKAEKALEESNKAALELQKFTAKFTPRTTSSILKSVLQGNLLTPISETANLVGNMSFLPFRAATRGIASGIDIIDSFITGKPREISVGPVSGTTEAIKGAIRGAKQIPDILSRGSGDVIKGESRAGLHPMRAWVDQFSKNPERPTEGGKLKLQDRLNLLIEGTFGVPAEAMLRGLGAGDAPFKEAARGRVVAEQLRLKKVPREQWDFAQKFPELFFDKETVAQIGRDTAAAVFQRESKTLSLLTRWLSGKGDVIDFLAATVAPYKLTPWNIIGEVLSYNPMVALARTAYEAKQGNRKAAKVNAGKMLVGSMMAGTAAWLYQKGLIAPSLDERDEAQKARVLSGQVLPPNHINVSGLKRAMEGGDPTFKAGDKTMDFFRSGGLMGSMLYMTANVGREFERKPEDAENLVSSILRQSTLEQARFGLNQSFLQGVEGLLTAIKEGNVDNYFRQWFSTVLSIPLPNSMATLSRSTREFKPDFREDEFKKQIGNVIKNRLGFSGYDDYLPLKRDFWGKPIPETPKDRNALFYHFFDVTKGQQVTDDPVALELYRLWRKTADSKVIPSLVEKEIRRGNQSSVLDASQQSRYAELVGGERRRIVDAMVINPNFHKLSDENKVKLLTRAYDTGLEIGKAKFLRENPALEQKPKRAGFNP